MKYLARLILSIESLLKNPVKWFGGQPWIFRILFPMLIVPLISVISIFFYQNSYQLSGSMDSDSNQSSSDIEEIKAVLEKYHDSQVQEIIYLREEVDELKQALKQNTNGDDVLGANDSNNDQENLQDRIKKFSPEDLINPDTKSIYVKTDIEDVVMHKLPSESSEKITNFEVGTFYPALEKKGDWQEIDFGNGSTAWIDTKYIIIFPIDENN